MEPWRLLISAPTPGPQNMALDQALAESVEAGQAPPTLRLYTWAERTLSIGYAQSIAAVDLAAAASEQIGVVRRRTGGQAILHADELTYAVALPRQHRFAGSHVMPSYAALNRGILAGLAGLGVPAQAGDWSPGTHDLADVLCFATPSRHEIAAAGHKIVGSAQARLKGAVLQHGSLALSHDPAAYRLLRRPPQRPPPGLRELLSHTPPIGALIEKFVAGFAAALAIRFIPGVLSPAEAARASTLVGVRYADHAWLHRR